MAGETFILAHYVAGLDARRVPPPVMERAKWLMLDFAGSAVRGRIDAEAAPSILAALDGLGLSGAGSATVMGDPRGWTPAAAALLNGAFGHSLDFDDTHAASSLHPSAPVVPAALAAAAMNGAGGREMLLGIVAGYETCCRIGLALDPTTHYARGFHPTATAGAFGAAAAAGRVLGLNPAQQQAAFGVAGSQAAGSLQFLADGGWNKPWQVGAAAMNGLAAAVLAREGFRGACEALEGVHGFLAGYSDGADPARLVAELGERFETLAIGVKPYPGCRYTHAAIDAILALKSAHLIRPSEVARIEIGLHRNGIRLTGAPEADKRRPRTIVAAQFSMPFAAALAIDRGRFGWDDYRRVGESALDALCDRVVVRQSDAVEAASPHPFGAHVAIETGRGRFVCAQPEPSGEPHAFPPPDVLTAKFLELTTPVLGDGAAALAAAILSLDGPGDAVGFAAARPSGKARV